MNQPKNSRQNKFTTNIFGDSYLPSVNSKKFEEIAYSTFFDIDLLPQLSKEFTFYIFIGTDSGMLLKHLQRLNIEPNSIYLFIEDTKIIQQLNKDILNIKQTNILISTIDKWQEQGKNADYIKYIKVDRVQTIKSFSALEQIYSPYSDIVQKLHNEINQLKWIHPDKFQRKLYIQRQIENCADNFNPAIQLKGLLKGKPALILAGGPSLDDYIDWIEECQQYYVVIAISRIARRLLSTKIVPDIFITADPFDTAFITSKEILAFGKKSILVNQAYAHPKLIGQWQGQHFFLGELLPWESDYKPENIKGIGPTVTNCAIHLAIQLGMTKQILLGVDLCHSKEGFSHASSTIKHDMEIELSFTGTSVKTNNKILASTTYEFSEARTSISMLAQLAQKKGGQLINPHPDSAYIKHVHHQRIGEIKKPDFKVDGFLLITNQLKTPSSEVRKKHYFKLKSELKQTREIAKEIFKKSSIIVKQSTKPFSEKKHPYHKNIASTIFNIKVELERFNTLINTIENFGINGFLDFIHNEEKYNTNNDLKLIEYYYTSLCIACDSFLDIIDSTIQRIKVRILEESSEADIKCILKQWGKDNDEHFGRMILLKKRNNFIYNQINQEKQSEFERYFKNNFNIKGSLPQERKYSKPIIKLQNMEKKLYDFFQKKDNNNLVKFIQQINKLGDEQSKSLAHLAQGYLFELENKNEQAINHYLNASHEQTLESGLKRILDISLKAKDLENVLTVLNILSDISPDYLIQLAELYKISQQYKDALDTYSQYLNINPHDILVLINVGILYLSLDVSDGAEFIFKHILEIDVNNQTAITYLKKIPNSLFASRTPVLVNNNLLFDPIKLLRFSDYSFFKSLNLRNINFEQLRNIESFQAISFFATKDNMSNHIFTNFIKKISETFSKTQINIFYLDSNIEKLLIPFIEDAYSNFKMIKPKNIYEVTQNSQIFIIYAEPKDIDSQFFQYISKTNNIIAKNCRNTAIITYFDKFVEETLEQASSRRHDVMDNYKFLGFTQHEIKNQPFYKVHFTKALSYESKKEFNYKYIKSDIRYFKTIELCLKNKHVTHYLHDFMHKELSLR